MDVWEIILYAFGAFLALRVLVALMQQHRRRFLHKLAAEHQRQLLQRSAAKKAEESAKKAA